MQRSISLNVERQGMTAAKNGLISRVTDKKGVSAEKYTADRNSETLVESNRG
jgi:hypothetical protein